MADRKLHVSDRKSHCGSHIRNVTLLVEKMPPLFFLEKLKRKKTMSHPFELQTGFILFPFRFFLLCLFFELLLNRRDQVSWLKSHQGKKFVCKLAESLFCGAPSPLEDVLKKEGTREETRASERVANKGGRSREGKRDNDGQKRTSSSF